MLNEAANDIIGRKIINLGGEVGHEWVQLDNGRKLYLDEIGIWKD